MPHYSRCLLIFLVTLVSTVIWVRPVTASGPGDLDRSFNGTGVVTSTLLGHSDRNKSMVIQPDGKIVIAGQKSNDADNYDFAVARYNPDGSPDTTFNQTGLVTTDVGSDFDYGASVALQPDNKIVVAGTTWVGSYNKYAVTRYHSNGSLDTDFNHTGIVTSPIRNVGFLPDLATQPDGKVVVIGSGWNGSNNDLVVNRYTVSGALDSTFNGTGIVTTAIGPETDDIGTSVSIQPDGKIVAAGTYVSNGDYSRHSNYFVARYQDNGHLDLDFHGTGIVTTSISSERQDECYAVAIQPDNKIILAGGSDRHFAVVRYDSDGNLDATFNNSGIVTTSIGSGASARSIAVQPDGKIVVTGGSQNSDKVDFSTVRYTAGGSLDYAFGAAGVVTTSIGSEPSLATSVALQPDLKIVLAGIEGGDSGFGNVVILRYLGGDPVIYLPLIFKE